jgi:hypothetical protein
MAAIGSYVTNLVTLDGVILALTVSVYPKKFAGATELVFAVIGWIFLVISIVCGIMANATQVDLLTESKLKPRGGALEAQARRCVISFALGAIALGVYGFLIRYNS